MEYDASDDSVDSRDGTWKTVLTAKLAGSFGLTCDFITTTVSGHLNEVESCLYQIGDPTSELYLEDSSFLYRVGWRAQ